MARLFADEDSPYEIVQALRRLGHDAVTTREAGRANQRTADGRAVLTRNCRHFMRLHMQQPGHAGIIVCTADLDFELQAQRIHAAISALDSLAGRLIRITRPGPGEEPT